MATEFYRRGSEQERGSTRHHRVDEAFLVLLEEDFGIDAYSLRKAFYGAPAAPKKQAIKVAEWAIRCAGGDVDEASKALRAWARNRGVGAYGRAGMAMSLKGFGDVERGDVTDPHYSTLCAIARGLGVALVELLADEPTGGPGQ